MFKRFHSLDSFPSSSPDLSPSLDKSNQFDPLTIPGEPVVKLSQTKNLSFLRSSFEKNQPELKYRNNFLIDEETL